MEGISIKLKYMKKIKVFFNGERLRDIYPHATRFQVLKWKIRNFFRKVVIASFVIGVIYGAFKIGSIVSADTVYMAERKTDTTLSVKIEQLKQEVVSKIKACESGGMGEDFGLVTFDPDRSGKTANIPSYGLLQFKKPTVIQYVKQLRGKDLTGKEAISLALDESEATKLAYEIIFQVKGGIWNWKNCAYKTGVAKDIEIIRKLEE